VPEQGAAEATADQAAALAPAGRTKDAEGKYIIRQGDTLWDISSSFLRDPFLWPLIWKVNPYITNPDLIYPGNKLTIPSLAPIERAMEAPEEQPAEEEVPARTPGETALAPLPLRPKPTTPTPEEEAPAPRKIILPEEAAIPLIDKYTMLNAGFLGEDESDDRITGSLEPKTIFGYDDVVYIAVPSKSDAQVGDKFLIYQPLKKVKHPVTGDGYGRLIKVMGILQVTARDPANGALTARITISFDAIEKDNLLTPYQEPTLLYESGRQRSKDVSGYIIEVLDGRTINAQTDIVYLDRGTADGVEPGDRFWVYLESDEQDQPRKMIGEVQVFLVKEHTATAVVRKSVDTLAKGDVVEFKK
jgi:LysM domain